MRKEIDINQWERKEHFEFYSKNATPHYCVAFNIDITNLLAYTRKNKRTGIVGTLENFSLMERQIQFIKLLAHF